MSVVIANIERASVCPVAFFAANSTRVFLVEFDIFCTAAFHIAGSDLDFQKWTCIPAMTLAATFATTVRAVCAHRDRLEFGSC